MDLPVFHPHLKGYSGKVVIKIGKLITLLRYNDQPR